MSARYRAYPSGVARGWHGPPGRTGLAPAGDASQLDRLVRSVLSNNCLVGKGCKARGSPWEGETRILARALEEMGSASRFGSEPPQTLGGDSACSIKGGLPKALSESLY